MSDFLQVNQVSKKYGNFTALNNVSISVPQQSIFGLLGPNGAGKTTLIRIINQITMPDSGSVYINGNALRPEHVTIIGYMPEERGLYKSMKVGEQALYLAQLKGLSKTQAKQQLKYWFDRLEISHWWDKKIEELSKGMAQKVQFIVTVLHRPKLLIFDEPFSGFDPVNANLIKNEILLLRVDGVTVIFSTHRMESVEELCDHIALINHANKVLDGKITEVKRQYKTNTYEVGLISDNEEALKKELQSKYEVEEAHFNSVVDELKLKIKLDVNSRPNDLLTFLTSRAQVNHFVEVIPSINEIFIQTVSASKP